MRVKLSDITNYSKGVQINGDDLIVDGEFAYLNGGINPSGRWNASNVNGNTVTISEGGNSSGYINYMTEPFWCGAHCYYLYDGPTNSKYLYYALKSQQDRMFNIRSGACMPNIKKSDLGNFEFEFDYDEEVQNRVVSILSTVETIITQRKKELESFDELIKARFVEMFGDPISNPLGWDKPLIEEVVSPEKNSLKAGPFGSSLKKEYYVESGYKIYGQEQVIAEDPNYGDYYIDEEKYRQLENCAVKAGDVLISLVGTYGKLLIMPNCFEPGIINPRLMKITFDKSKVNPYYFKHFFQSESLKRALADNTHGGTMDILNLGIVRKIAMPLPPVELQNEFVAFTEQVDKSKSVIQKSLNEVQQLFDSLMQVYFG